MDNRPIGVFDSGLGGLTAVRKLTEILPGEDIVYLGDTGRVPYGSRSKKTIIKYSREDIAFLRRFDIKAIMAACGTASTNAVDDISGDYSLPVHGVVMPAAERAAALTRNGRIGVIGTAATVKSGAFEKAIGKKLPGAEIIGKACPLFVPLVENGRISGADCVLRTVAEEYLLPLKAADVDVLILACTHYPLITDTIGDIMGSEVRLVDSGAEAALRVAGELREKNLLNGRSSGGALSCYVTDATDGFASIASLFLSRDIYGSIEQIELESF